MTSTRQYDENTPVNEPIEIRLAFIDQKGRDHDKPMTYLGSVTDNGAIRHTLIDVGGRPNSLSNVQSKGVTMPLKAVAGWQIEALAYFEASLYTIVGIR